MTIEKLIQDAERLQQPTSEAHQEFVIKQARIIEKLNDALLADAAFQQVIAEENHAMLKDNHNNQLRFMASVYQHFNPETFVNIILWAFKTYRSHGFDVRYWDYLFPAIRCIYREELSEQAFLELEPFYAWMEKHKKYFLGLSDEPLENED